MPAPTREEITQKLADLKAYSREFDKHEARWKVAGGERTAYSAMCEAERNYITLSDWLWLQGILVEWDREMQEYVVRNEKVLFKRLSR